MRQSRRAPPIINAPPFVTALALAIVAMHGLRLITGSALDPLFVDVGAVFPDRFWGWIGGSPIAGGYAPGSLSGWATGHRGLRWRLRPDCRGSDDPEWASRQASGPKIPDDERGLFCRQPDSRLPGAFAVRLGNRLAGPYWWIHRRGPVVPVPRTQSRTGTISRLIAS